VLRIPQSMPMAGPSVVFRFWDDAGRQQKPLSAHQGKITLALLCGQQSALPMATHKRNVKSTIERPNRDGARPKAQDASVAGCRPRWAKPSFPIPVQLVGIGDLGDTGRRRLARSDESGPALRDNTAYADRMGGKSSIPKPPNGCSRRRSCRLPVHCSPC
jgi:hypothetical protein